MSLTTTTLNNGLAMPLLGLGVWQINSDAETERVSVLLRREDGHFDLVEA